MDRVRDKGRWRMSGNTQNVSKFAQELDGMRGKKEQRMLLKTIFVSVIQMPFTEV